MTEQLTKEQSDIIAVQLMKEIQYDNGWVNRHHAETYNKKWVNKISEASQTFFSNNPGILTDDDIFNICCGEYSENQRLYGKLTGYSELDKVLNAYFNEF